MKICFITTGDIKDIATAKRALGMANPLTDLGYQVSILMQDSEENRKRVAMECDNRIEVYFYPKGSAKQEIRTKCDLLKNLSPDIVYLCAFVLRNIPFFYRKKTILLTEHSELQSGISDVKGVKRIFTLAMEYYSIIKSDGLLNASRYLEETFTKRTKKLGLKRPSLYFPYAFNRDLYKPVQARDLPSNYQTYQESFNFVFLGTITRNYGAFTMLEAFGKVVNDFPNARLFMLGKGRHYKDALAYVEEHRLKDQVYLPGFVEEEDISNYFTIANAFISPMNDTIQDWARCPSKLYMYLPFQKPIVSCKIGETYETLKDKGYYYSPNNSDSLAESMIRLIEQKDTTIFTDFELHSWQTRTKELHQWIQKNYK